MKNLIQSLFVFFIILSSYAVLATDDISERAEILAQSKAFSQAFIKGDIDTLMAIYSPNARIVNGNNKIKNDILAIRKYWTPKKENQWQLTSHEAIPEELIIEGNMASDIGYYAGVSQHLDGRKNQFGGAYVIVWRKIDGVWRIHIDMWNNVK